MMANVSDINTAPRWKGFNLLDFFLPSPDDPRPATKEEYFKWMSDWGFDFVRIPMAYPYYLDYDRSTDIHPEQVYQLDEAAIETIDELVAMAHKYDMHVSLNLHRAPGYCINAGFNEPYNLWFDDEAQRAFLFHWEMWAKRYKNVSRENISFDLINEPAMREDMNDQHAPITSLPGEIYRNVTRKAIKAIHSVNPDHLVIAGGNDAGATLVPELLDLEVIQSCRGYFPHEISHYKAWWVYKEMEGLPDPKWPGQVGDAHFSREMLESFYAPWIEAVKNGTGVHCGECGCYKKTPHDVFLAWFEDVLDIFATHGIGFALWEFSGEFGILDSGREDVEYEDWYGHKLDRKLLDLLIRK
ncbi:cellulase family glycosylhydrolase [Balneolaceae bacterium ANBcel3]|nr:cellulase family glycosylhydrolase [Balneolaceae bacterium ANBcel3]